MNGAVILAGAAAVPLTSGAATDTYFNLQGGNWSDGTRWSLGHQPGNLDDAILNAALTLGATITYDAAATATNLASLTIDQAAHHTLVLSQALNTLTTGFEYIGFAGSGNLSISGGTHNVNGALYFGVNAGSSGNGVLSGGSLNTGEIFVGNAGGGTFNQTGGLHTINGAGGNGLFVGFATGSTGVYTLSDGELDASSNAGEVIGYSGSGNLNISGGTNFVEATSTNGLIFGYNAGSTGSGILSGNGVLSASQEIIGYSGSGAFNQSGGNHNASVIALAYNIGSSGTYSISAGSLGAFQTWIGYYGSGLLNQNGGSLGTNAEYVGYYGSGIVNQSGGTNQVSGDLLLGVNAGSTGTYNLSNSASFSAYDEIIGNGGSGAFNQTGGVNAITFNLAIGARPGGSGTVIISGGAAIANAVYVGGSSNGIGGVGQLNVSGASLSVSSLIQLYSAGSLIINGGTVNAGSLVVASTSNFTFNSGTLNLAGGTSSISQPLFLGNNGGSATLNQSGATTSVNDSFGLLISSVNPTSGTYGTYNLLGGSLSAVDVFVNSGGTLNLLGGSLSTGFLTISTGGALTGFGVVFPTNQSTLPNAGILMARSGNLVIDSPNLNNSGLLSNDVAANLFINSASVTNTGNITVNAQGGVVFAAPLSNGAGQTITLNGGVLGSPQITNNGTITGFGQISGDLVNNGTAVTFIGPTQIVGNLTNSTSGSISISNAQLLITGSTVNNGYMKSYGQRITFNGPYGGSGTYDSDPADNFFLSDVNVSDGGRILGSIGDRFVIAGTYSNAGTYLNAGGSLSAQNVINQGSFTQSAGQATMLALSGTGTTTVGGGAAATALVSVASFAQGSVTINGGGTLAVRRAAARVTNSASTLTITNTGLLDLGNHALLVDNTATPESLVHQYLHNGYNADASGIGNWLGKGGITSSDAIASHNGTNPDFRISVGYVNGNYANDPLIAGPIPGQETLPTNRTLIRPALYGDLNLDGKVDDTDLAIFSGLGQYNQPTDRFGWLGGDLNHDGKVDDTDLLIFSGAGNYNGPTYGTAGAGASHASATPSLTGHTEANGDIILSAATSQGVPGDGVLDFVYNPSTGHLTLSYDGDPRVTASQPFQVVRFKSAGGHFIPGNFNQTDFGAGVTATTTALNGTASGSNSVPDGYDMGAVLPTGLTVADLTSDLTLQWNVFGGGLTLKNGDLVVPEPAMPCALAVAFAALSGRRRRRRPRRGDKLDGLAASSR